MNDIASKVLVGIGVTVGVAIIFWLYRQYGVPLGTFLGSLGSLVSDVATIKCEVQTNGGKSLKDRVVGIGNSLAIVEARQRGLVATQSRAIFETDAMFNWIDTNMAVERLTGYGSAHLERRRWISHIHEHDRDSVMAEIIHAISDKRVANASFRFIHSTGEAMTVRLEATPIFSPVIYDTDNGPPVLSWFGSLARTGPQTNVDDNQRPHSDQV